MNAGGGFEKLLDVEGGAQQDRIVGGSALIAERMAEGLEDRVRTGFLSRAWPAAPTASSSAARRTGPREAGGARGAAARPPHDHVRARAPLIACRARRGVEGRQPHQADSHLRRASGETTTKRRRRRHHKRSEITFDNTPPSGKPGALVGFVGAADAPGYAELPHAGRREVALGGLARLFGPKALEADRFLERDWLAEEWARGGPVSNLGPGVLADMAERSASLPAVSIRRHGVRLCVVRLHGRRGALG